MTDLPQSLASFVQPDSESHENFVWSAQTFDAGRVPEWARSSFELVLPYLREFLCSDHPFRPGKVCPFVPAAVRGDRMYFSLCAETSSRQVHVRKIMRAADSYIHLKKQRPGFGALIILFPGTFDIGELLEIHYLAREYCITRSLMLGALYPINQAASIHNPAYHPLRTPVPILVIRELVASDLVFLDPTRYSIRKRLLFLRSFIRAFEHEDRHHIRAEVEKARFASARYRRRLWTIWICASALTVLAAAMLF